MYYQTEVNWRFWNLLLCFDNLSETQNQCDDAEQQLWITSDKSERDILSATSALHSLSFTSSQSEDIEIFMVNALAKYKIMNK